MHAATAHMCKHCCESVHAGEEHVYVALRCHAQTVSEVEQTMESGIQHRLTLPRRYLEDSEGESLARVSLLSSAVP